MAKQPEPGYERGITKLIALVSRIYASATEWSPTPLRKELDELATRLEEIADLLARQNPAQWEVQQVHDESEPPEIGVDGYPLEDAETGRLSYEATKWAIRDVARSARKASSRLPDARQKMALPFAARGLLHLRYEYEYPKPRFSNNSADVIELDRVCRAANIHLSRERLRGALAASFRDFDPLWRAAEYDELFK